MAFRIQKFEDVPARITSPARTVVDCFRFERLVGREAALEALQDALRDRQGDHRRPAIECSAALPSRRLSAILEAGSAMSTNIADSVKARLLNQWIEAAWTRSLNFFFVRYACERFLYRLGQL